MRDSTISSTDPYSMNSVPITPSTTAIQVKLRAAAEKIAIATRRRHEDAERGVVRRHRALDQPGARRLAIELREDQHPPLLEHFVLLGMRDQLLEALGQRRGCDR